MGHADEHAGLSSVPDEGSRKTWVAAGGILGAVAASSCCILPLGLFSLGVGGAWIGNLTALAPYQPIFVVITLGFLGYGYWLVYRKPKTDCKDTSVCTSSSAGRTVRIVLWSATALVAAAAAFPYVGPLLLGV